MQSDGVIVDSGAMTAALQPLEMMPRWWQRTGTSPFTIVKPSFGLKRRSWIFEGAEFYSRDVWNVAPVYINSQHSYFY